MSRLQDIEEDLRTIEKEIKKLEMVKYELIHERDKIIQDNCEHELKSTMYSAIRDGVWKNEVVCVKCGLTQWEEI